MRRGTVHAIVGENGAGKSTLMKTLYGMHRPEEGTISVDGETVVIHSPSDAIARGIGMVHQHFQLADNLTVLENVVLGDEPTRRGWLDFGAARRKIMEISDAYGLDVDPDSLVEDLGVGDRQRVEILKVLYRGARTLILDEPTAVLVPQEVDELFGALRGLKEQGMAIIFISHKLDEVLKVADEITVIRRGTTVASVLPGDVTSRQLAELMVGSELPSPETRESTVTDRPLLTVSGLGLTSSDGRPLLSDISFTIHAGEVLGIAGVEGNGQAELVETLMGMRHASAGTVVLGDEDISHWSTRRRRETGVAYIPEDRTRHGLLLDAPLWENRMLGHQTQAPERPRPLHRPAWGEEGHQTDRRRLRRTDSVHRRPRLGAVGWQPAEAHRRPRDERRPDRARGGAPDPRGGRRSAGCDLGSHPGRARPRARRAPGLGRPGRADRAVRLPQGDAARPAGRGHGSRSRHP